MKIGMFVNQLHNNEWEMILKSCIISTGNTPVPVVDSYSSIEALIVVGMCWFNYENAHVIEQCKDDGIPVIMIDSGIHYNYWTVCLNEDKRLGIEYSEDYKFSDSRRRSFLNCFGGLADWRKAGNSRRVSILLHYLKGYEHIKSIEEQQKEIDGVVAAVREMGYDPLVLEHPRDRNVQNPNISSIGELNKVIEFSDFCISWYSNALCHSIIKGVPSVCLSEDSFAFDMSAKTLGSELIYPDRDLWVNQMSYCHFNKREIIAGIPLKVILGSI